MGYMNYLEMRTTRADGTVRVQEFRGPGAMDAMRKARSDASRNGARKITSGAYGESGVVLDGWNE